LEILESRCAPSFFQELSFHFCHGGIPALIPPLAKLVGRGIHASPVPGTFLLSPENLNSHAAKSQPLGGETSAPGFHANSAIRI
jgi:hypothetical protein